MIKQASEVETHESTAPSNEKWEPLIEKDEVKVAKEYGFSFGSKKVGQAPSVVNLRFMCHCLARAIKKHLDFNPNDEHFLQDIETDIRNDFTYNFSRDLKLTLHPEGGGQFQIEAANIDSAVIEISSKLQGDNNFDKSFHQHRSKEPAPESMQDVEESFGRDDLEESQDDEDKLIDRLRQEELHKSILLKDKQRIN